MVHPRWGCHNNKSRKIMVHVCRVDRSMCRLGNVGIESAYGFLGHWLRECLRISCDFAVTLASKSIENMEWLAKSSRLFLTAACRFQETASDPRAAQQSWQWPNSEGQLLPLCRLSRVIEYAAFSCLRTLFITEVDTSGSYRKI